MIDIVVTTCERPNLLRQTLEHIWNRTRTPYRLHVLDDASTRWNTEYLTKLIKAGRVSSIHLREQRAGIPAQLRLVAKTGTTDPIVFTDDDVLCPDLEPDWLARGIDAMQRFPKLGLLALNSPQCNIDHKRGEVQPGDPVTLCRNIPGTFVFARRTVLKNCQPPEHAISPVKAMCRIAREQGWEVGYLTHVFCQHIGTNSVRKNKNLRGELELVSPVDEKTLEPPREYQW